MRARVSLSGAKSVKASLRDSRSLKEAFTDRHSVGGGVPEMVRKWLSQHRGRRRDDD